MVLLPATAVAIPHIRSIVDATWPHAYGHILTAAQISYMIGRFYSNAALEQQIAAGHRFLLAVADGEPVGFAGFELSYEASTAKLHKLYVLPEAQGAGVGAALLSAVEQAAIAGQQRFLTLNVNRYNQALHFYRKYGFEVWREEDIDIGDGYFMNDYVMGKPLQD